jgi:hypothetical protein
MIHHEPISFVLQPDDLADRRRNFNYARNVVLTELGHNLINAFLVGIPTAGARRTGEAVGCLVSGEKQHPAAL